MAATKKQELAVIDFTQFSVAQLPELKGKKEEIASIIEANPIVEIVDNATYESAKKSRTAVKTLRTGLEKEQKDVKKKIKEHVLDVVDSEYDILILGVKASEQSRQEPIDVWEAKKEEERKEKARLEQERIDGIKAKINEFKQNWESKILELVFNNCQSLKEDLAITENEFDRVSLAEFDILFDREVSYLKDLLNSKIKTLTEQEQIRIDNLLIQEKNAEQSKIQEWQRTWNANIDSLTFNDITDVKSILVKSKLVDLKHYNSGYEEIYLSTEKRLHSQIEFVSKAEEQRIAQEKLDQEKKEFEEKQAESKFQSRVKQLTDIGIDMAVFELEHKGDHRWMNLKTSAKIESDSDWNETLAWVNMQISLRDEKVDNKVTNNSVPVTLSETIEVVVEEVVEEKDNDYPWGNQDEKVFQNLDVEKTNVNWIEKNDGSFIQEDRPFSEDVQEVEFEKTLYQGTYKNLSKTVASFELVFAIIDLPKFEHLKIKELLEPYNVPTLKQ